MPGIAASCCGDMVERAGAGVRGTGLHGYEGHAWRTAVQPVHIAHGLGASILLATNAAGGIRADLQPGDLMAVRGHIDSRARSTVAATTTGSGRRLFAALARFAAVAARRVCTVDGTVAHERRRRLGLR